MYTQTLAIEVNQNNIIKRLQTVDEGIAGLSSQISDVRDEVVGGFEDLQETVNEGLEKVIVHMDTRFDQVDEQDSMRRLWTLRSFWKLPCACPNPNPNPNPKPNPNPNPPTDGRIPTCCAAR